MAEEIRKDGVLYAIVYRSKDWKKGLNFLTPDELSLQVGTFWYQEGKQCKPHKHIKNERCNDYTQECNIVLEGAVQVKVYDDDGRFLDSKTLLSGDLMIMVAGGHSFEILQPDTKIIECKNGPFISVEKDKMAL